MVSVDVKHYVYLFLSWFQKRTELVSKEDGGELDSHEEVRLSFAGSRRDQEEGGGAGPSGKPRRIQEQRGGARLRKRLLLLQLFLNSCTCYGHCPYDSVPHSGCVVH